MVVSRGRGETGHLEPVGHEALLRESKMVIAIKNNTCPESIAFYVR